MCDSKYHEEACRKARVIERRAEAQQRMMGKPDQVQTTSGPMPGYVNKEAYQTCYQEQFYGKMRSDFVDMREKRDPQRTPIVQTPPSATPILFRSGTATPASGRQSIVSPGRLSELTPLPTPEPAALNGTLCSPSPPPNAINFSETQPKTIWDTTQEGFNQDIADFDSTFAMYHNI